MLGLSRKHPNMADAGGKRASADSVAGAPDAKQPRTATGGGDAAAGAGGGSGSAAPPPPGIGAPPGISAPQLSEEEKQAAKEREKMSTWFTDAQEVVYDRSENVKITLSSAVLSAAFKALRERCVARGGGGRGGGACVVRESAMGDGV